MSSVLRALRKLEQETYAASGRPGRPEGIGAKTGHGLYPVNPVWRHRLRTAMVVLLIVLAGFGAVSAARTWLFSAASPETGTDRRVSGEPGHGSSNMDLADSGKQLLSADVKGSDSDAATVTHSQPVQRPDSKGHAFQQPNAGVSRLDAGVVPDTDAKARNNDGRKLVSSRPASAPDAFNVPSEFAEDDAAWRVINKDTVLPLETAAEGSDDATFDSVPSDSADLIDPSDPFVSSPSTSTATVTPPATPEFPELDPSAGVSLQAISWSPDPARRLAVINGRLCREGESVEGFVLVRINPDDVLLSGGRVSGRLVFKIR